MDIRPGNLIFGPEENNEYKVLQPLGNGNFGIVYEVEGPLKEHYALKTINTAWLDQNNLNAFINEGQLAVGINHPNVLKIIYFHDGHKHAELPPYMLMELADGGTLQNILEQKKEIKQYFSNQEIREMILDLANGMSAINEKLIHRDIKPDNILIKNGVLKVADFGLSKVVDAATRSQTFKGIQHIMYAAPEVWMQEKNTIAMDIYSMGIVYYEIATLKHPYPVKENGDIVEAWKNAHLTEVPTDPRKYNSDIDLGLSQIILKMISKRVADRYNSWSEIISKITSDGDIKEIKHDVSSLIERALKTKYSEEEARMKKESEARKSKEQEGIANFAFNDILGAVKQLVETFNEKYEFSKLKLESPGKLIFNIFVDGKPQKTVKVLVNVLFDAAKIDGKDIKAWGYVKAPSGRGFNLVLASSGPEDIYGKWLILQVFHNPIARKNDGRPEPFPFELDELPRANLHLNSVSEYDVKTKPFSCDLFVKLIEELL
ncbi:MAG: serine/threonine-protein kinase [Candidatus Humimicrobiaceae bacterium]